MSYRVGKTIEPLVSIVSSLAVALDRDTGRQLWRYQASTRIVRIVYTSDRIFLLDYDCLLHCLRAADGGLLGKVQVDDANYTGCALVPGPNGELYIGTSNCVVALDPTGREMWRFKHVNVPSSAAAGLAGLALPGAVVQPDLKD